MFIGKQVRSQLAERGFADDAGTRFYTFTEIADPTAFKNAYRARLDAAPLDNADKLRVVAETQVAYDLNSALLAELGEDYERAFSS